MRGNCEQTQRKLQPCATNLVVGRQVELVRGLYHGRRSFQRFGVALVSVGVLEENPVASADRKFSVAKNIVSKAQARRRIEEMSRHAAGRDSVVATLNKAVKDVAGSWHDGPGLAGNRSVFVDCRSGGRAPGCRFKVTRLVADVFIGPEHAYAQTEVECQPGSDAPVVLKVRLDDLVAVVILGLRRSLGKLADVAGQQVCERVAGRHRRGGAEGKGALVVAYAWLVFLRGDEADAKEQSLLREGLSKIVAVGVSGVRVFPWEVAVSTEKPPL